MRGRPAEPTSHKAHARDILGLSFAPRCLASYSRGGKTRSDRVAACPTRPRDGFLTLPPRPQLALSAILVVAAAILVSEAVADSVTVDEFAHLPAGVYYLLTGHFDVYNLSPPLLRELAALPVLAARPAGDFARFTTFPQHWAPGYEFMERNGDRYQTLYLIRIRARRFSVTHHLK